MQLIGDVFVGSCCIIFGLILLAGLLLFQAFVTRNSRSIDIYSAIALFSGVTAYAIVGELFIVVGLKQIFGDRGWIGKMLARSLISMALLLAFIALMIGVVFIIILIL